VLSVLVQSNNAVFTGSVANDVRVIGLGVVILLLIIVLVGLDWEAVVGHIHDTHMTASACPCHVTVT